MCQHHSFSLWLQVMNDLLKFPQLPVTSYSLSSLASMWSHHHSLSLWLQGMKDLSKFPQLPVTSYTLSSLYLATMCFHIIYYSLASSNVRLTTVPTVPSYLTALALVCHHHVSLSSFKEWKIYQSSHSYQLPSHPFIPRLCVPSSSIAILLRGMKHLLQFPQLPVA